MNRFPPLPPEPPEPPMPRRSPWLPEPRQTSPGPVWASASLVLGGPDWLAQRLLDQRLVALAGALDVDTANRAVAELALLDASGDAPVRLRLSGVTADLDVVLTLVDALDLMSAPVHATALGTLAGPAIALLAVADSRTVGPHTTFHLHEPRSPVGVPGAELEAAAAEHARRVRRLQERLADACGRSVDEIAADMHPGRILDADEAREYGLVDAIETGRRRPSGIRG
jgi:ATP-dependent Clp protease, protease subunit